MSDTPHTNLPGPLGDDAFDAAEAALVSYLDGTMPAGARESFEASIAADPELRARIEDQRAIDASVKRLFPVHKVELPAEVLNGEAAAIPIREAGTKKPTRKVLYYAAAAVLLLGSAFFVNRAVQHANPDFKLMGADALYTVLSQKGWKPEVVCTTDEAFARFVDLKLGEAMIAAPANGVAILGWGYSSGYEGTPISPDTVMLLATVDDQRVLVLMDREKVDRSVKVKKETGLNVFRREVGSLVTYEVTPLSESRVIPLLKPVPSTLAPNR